MENYIGQQAGDYRLVRLLGQGEFAGVYLGEHIHQKTLAAIKILRLHLSQDDQEHFLSETRTIAHLRHPHIVPVLDSGVQEGMPFLVMDYIPGGTLRQRHSKGSRLTPLMILPYVNSTAEALYYAHAKGMVHRNIKPENMLLGADNEVLLADFGLATGVQSSRSQNLEQAAGTAAYMAPELLQGKPCPASDQYALAIVVYEWLSGNVPFQGSFSEIAGQHVLAAPPPLEPPSVSLEVEAVVMTALAKSPADRFASIQAFASAFEQATLNDDETIRVRPASQPLAATVYAGGDSKATRPAHVRPPSFLPTPTVPEEPPALLTTQRPIQRRSPLRRVAIALVVLALLIITGDLAYVLYAAVLRPAPTVNAPATVQARQTQQAQATAEALQNLYTTATSGQVILNNPLSKNDGQIPWFVNKSIYGECAFTGGSYHASDVDHYIPMNCAAEANFGDFAYQVQMTIIRGNAGGLFFRGTTDANGLRAYQFSIDQSGFYNFDVISSTQGGSPFNTLLQRPSSAIKTGLDQTNLLTVIAKGDSIDLFINRQCVGEVHDDTSQSGLLGVLAWATPDATEVAFSNAQVWAI